MQDVNGPPNAHSHFYIISFFFFHITFVDWLITLLIGAILNLPTWQAPDTRQCTCDLRYQRPRPPTNINLPFT